ncbi:MAG TPA: hypothetical protein VF820_05245, partial [Patescibacteria group bacterium]
KRLINYFFWFEIQDSVDDKAVEFIKNKSFGNAIKTWSISKQSNSIKNNIYKKNLAILYCLLLLTETEQNKVYIEDSLTLWKSITESDKFWGDFFKVYKLNDDLDTSTVILNEFPKNVVNILSDIYTDIEKRYKNNLVLAEFSKVFKGKGTKLEAEILNPVFEEITSYIESLNNIKISKDTPVEVDTYKDIKLFISNLQKLFNQLIDLGFYDDSQAKKLRDQTAIAIRRIVLDIYNFHGEHEKAVGLLNIAQQISGTDGQEFVFKEDLKILEKNKKQNEISDALVNFVKNEQFEKALKLIEDEEENVKNTSDMKQFLKVQKKAIISNILGKKYQEATELFNKKDFTEANELYKDLIALIWKDIDIFDLNREALDDIIKDINLRTSGLNAKNFAQIDTYRNQLVSEIEKKLGDTYDAVILRFFIDAYVHVGVIPIIKKLNSRNNIANILYILGWLTVWFNGVGLIFFIIGWIYKNRN